jgi:hypothetical protein
MFEKEKTNATETQREISKLVFIRIDFSFLAIKQTENRIFSPSSSIISTASTRGENQVMHACSVRNPIIHIYCFCFGIFEWGET